MSNNANIQKGTLMTKADIAFFEKQAIKLAEHERRTAELIAELEALKAKRTFSLDDDED